MCVWLGACVKEAYEFDKLHSPGKSVFLTCPCNPSHILEKCCSVVACRNICTQRCPYVRNEEDVSLYMPSFLMHAGEYKDDETIHLHHSFLWLHCGLDSLEQCDVFLLVSV